ncbi:MAG: hypothetical protein AAGI54_13875 [Planctomycetota bacterium]
MDVLIEPPAGVAARGGLRAADGSAGLWTLRLGLPGGDPAGWRGGEVLTGVELAPHRRRYLAYQGPVDGAFDEPGRRGPGRAGRGSVRRLDGGVAWAARWGASRVELGVWLAGSGGWRWRLDRLAGTGEGVGVGARWRLGVVRGDGR